MIYAGVQRVIDVLLEVNPEDFDMAKRSRCIAGHCDSISNCPVGDLCSNVFADVSGVSQDIADRVVYPSFNRNEYAVRHANVGQAIRMLEILRDTGEVQWDKALGLV